MTVLICLPLPSPVIVFSLFAFFQFPKRHLYTYFLIGTILVHTLERRDGLALVLVQSVANDATVAKVDLAVGLLLE